jgi:TctA family transporter
LDDGRAAEVIGVAIAAVGLGVVVFRAAQRWLSTIALVLSLILGVIVRINTKDVATLCSGDSATSARSGLSLLVVAACVCFLASLAGVLMRPGESRDWTSVANDGGSRPPQERSLV